MPSASSCSTKPRRVSIDYENLLRRSGGVSRLASNKLGAQPPFSPRRGNGSTLMSEPTRKTAIPRVADRVYESVRELVMDQHIEQGSRVTIDHLARDLGVSHTPVREALARLEADGLVTRTPNRGYTIAPLLSEEEFESLYEVRMLLEPYTAARAAERASENVVAALHSTNDEMRQVLKQLTNGTTYREYHDFASLDSRFHETIATASGNALILDLLQRCRAHTHLYRIYFNTGVGVTTVSEHDRIVAGIRHHQPSEAAARMRDHLLRSRDRLSGTFQHPTGLETAMSLTEPFDEAALPAMGEKRARSDRGP